MYFTAFCLSHTATTSHIALHHMPQCPEQPLGHTVYGIIYVTRKMMAMRNMLLRFPKDIGPRPSCSLQNTQPTASLQNNTEEKGSLTRM